jgi:RES domain-containing protein
VVAERLTRPLRAPAWSCRFHDAPSASPLDLISDQPNRWSAAGEPTVYVSGDPALALLEAGRHPDDVGDRVSLVRVELRIPLAVDLRDPNVRQALELPADLEWILDRRRTQAVSSGLRHSGVCDGLIVPSAGALDQLDRWNAVIFADDRQAVLRVLGAPKSAGGLEIDPTPVTTVQT